ncbi:MAG: chemotaxis protein CheW [Kofleriaceae bacterium]|nr:chemotaxis protein CheW [Kofleriaceae bacterium]
MLWNGGDSVDNDDSEIVGEFLMECQEGLDQLDQDLVALEERPTDGELLDRIFRCIHTVKGTSGFLAFGQLEKIAHVGENLLSELRDGNLLVNAEIISALLSTIDAFRDLLTSIEATGEEHVADNRALITLLTALYENGVRPEEAMAPVAEATPQQETAEATPQQETAEATPQQETAAAATPEKAAQNKTAPVKNSFIRVDVQLLDMLMNLVGELVLVRNQVVQYTQDKDEPAFLAVSQRLNQVTSELQEGIMQTRMQPIGSVWGKFPRVVRDLAVTCGKQVAIHMEGAETELDKTLIEAIKDPLTHAVRNAIDHGIETPETREVAGKPREGTMTLRAYHEGGQVNIEVSDDGAGIDCEKVRARAVERGLVSPDEAQMMTERESIALLFRPGFSTAAAVTNVSGRGVGMDVVKTSIEKIGGSVDLQSELGRGSVLKIKIPLTLAIVPALLIRSGGDRYAIPQVNLLQLIRLEGEQIKSKVEMVLGAPVFNLRGKLLPLVSLNKQLEVEVTESSDAEQVLNIVVLQADDQQFGLVVDEINDTEEIVVKPLSEQLKGLKAYAGATILGEGKVALILDVLGLAEKSRVVTDHSDRRHSEIRNSGDVEGSSLESLLLFGDGENGRLALPLRQVERLEKFPQGTMEKSGEFHVVQYRGEVMPLIHVSQIIPNSNSEPDIDGPLNVVVYSHKGGRIGLVVDEILDIVYVEMSADDMNGTEPILGSVLVDEKVTDVINVERVLGSNQILAPKLMGAQHV